MGLKLIKKINNTRHYLNKNLSSFTTLSIWKSMNRTLIISLIQISLIPFTHTFASTCNYNSPGYIINRFIDNGNGTVTDSYTGLIWQRCIMGRFWNTEAQICNSASGLLLNNWKEVLDNVVTHNNTELSNGRDYDWRLPNIKELASITNLNCFNPAIDTSIFFVDKSYLWSSTPSAFVEKHILNNSGTPYTYENNIWNISVSTGKEQKDPWSSKKAALLVRGSSSK